MLQEKILPGKADVSSVALSSTLGVQAGVVQGKGQSQFSNQITCQFLNCVCGLFFSFDNHANMIISLNIL